MNTPLSDNRMQFVLPCVIDSDLGFYAVPVEACRKLERDLTAANACADAAGKRCAKLEGAVLAFLALFDGATQIYREKFIGQTNRALNLGDRALADRKETT